MTDSDLEILEYCEPHVNQMWASVIIGIILKCDFRDAERTLKEFRKEG